MKISRTRKIIGIVILSCLFIIILGGLLFVLSPDVQAKYHWWMIKWEEGKGKDNSHTCALAMIGEPSLPYVKAGLKSSKPYIRLASLQALLDMVGGYLSGYEYVEYYLSTKPSELSSLVKQDPEIMALIKGIKLEDGIFNRHAAILILFWIKKDDVLDDIKPLLQDKSASIRDEAALLLAALHEKNVIPCLIDILEIGIFIQHNDTAKVSRLQGDRGFIPAYDSIFTTYVIGCKNYLEINVAPAQKSLLNLLGTLCGYDLNNPKATNEESIRQIRNWWQENNNYLYWSDTENHFVVDHEAKASGIPTEEYRKTHPWPTDSKIPNEPAKGKPINGK